MHPAAESRHLDLFFDYLNKNKITYCVMNNYIDYPEVIPSDIDITISEAVFEDLDKHIQRFATETQLLITQKIWHGYNKCAYILSPAILNHRFRLQLDFFVDFTAKGYWKLINHEDMIASAVTYKNFYIPSPYVEIVFLLMRRIIKGDASASKIEEIRSLYRKSQAHKTEMTTVFGTEMTDFVDAAVRNPEEILITHLAFSRRFLRRYSSNRSKLFYKLKYRTKEIPRLIQRIKHPVGLAICFLSPDGGGKTTIISGVENALSGSFHGVCKRYWRPGLLPHMGRLKFWNPSLVSDSNPDPHGHGPQNPVKSFIRFCYYLTDFVIGFYARVAPMRIRKQLVIFDRYYFDYLVDLHRYKMTIPKWIPRLFLRLVPKPDITFVLDSPAEVMLARKQELSFDEIERQRSAYIELNDTQKNFIVVNSNASIDDVCGEVITAVLQKKAAITALTLKLS